MNNKTLNDIVNSRDNIIEVGNNPWTLKDLETACRMHDKHLSNMRLLQEEEINRIISSSKKTKYCQCRFAMIRRDQKTQKAYCFECKKEIQKKGFGNQK